MTRILLLGSLPGERSLSAQQYYAHPTNTFWWLIGGLLSEPEMTALPYRERLARLKSHGIGLWDVIASAKREGSLDAAIKGAIPRDLLSFGERLPHLRAIGFNGATAAKLGRRQLAGHLDRWMLVDLPSSSAAHAAMSRQAKLEAWRAIVNFKA